MNAALMLCLAIFVVVCAHTVQIWVWAVFLHLNQTLATFETSFYFATITYTTLGYGDIVLMEDKRVFTSFAAITGLLNFGVSTAFLMAMIVRILPTGLAER